MIMYFQAQYTFIYECLKQILDEKNGQTAIEGIIDVSSFIFKQNTALLNVSHVSMSFEAEGNSRIQCLHEYPNTVLPTH